MSTTTSSILNNEQSQPTLSQTYNDHPIVWLDPSVYNAQNQQYPSIDHATRAYNKEKQQIISCYERQLQVQQKYNHSHSKLHYF